MFSLIKFYASLNGFSPPLLLPQSPLLWTHQTIHFDRVTFNLGNCHTGDQSSQPKNSTKDFWKTACPA